MAVTILTGSAQAAGINYSYRTSGSADWSSVPTGSVFYDQIDRQVRYRDSQGNIQQVYAFPFTGSAIISGSLTVTGSINGTISSASYATNALSASYAPGGGLTYFTEAQNTTSPNDTVYVDSLTASGSSTNIDIAIAPKGTGAFTLAIPDGTGPGGAKRGQYAVDLQLGRSYFSRVASGNYSFAAGSENSAQGVSSIAIGTNANATGTQSIIVGGGTSTNSNSLALGYVMNATGLYSAAVGYYTIASGQQSSAFGNYNTVTGLYSLGLGYGVISNGIGGTAIGFGPNNYGRYGSLSWAGGSSTAQVSKMIYRGNTSDATLTSLNAQEYFDDANNTFSLQNNSAYRFKGTVIGKQSGSTNVAAWDIDGLIVRGATAATTTLVVGNVNVVDNTPAWGTPVMSANTSLGSLKVQVQGAAATNIRWAVSIEATEVIYA